MDDIVLEKGLFAAKSGDFERIFSVKPVIKKSIHDRGGGNMETAKEYFKPEYFENRELSWIKFDERVLNEARDKTIPLLERLKFVSITSSNLDEFLWCVSHR